MAQTEHGINLDITATTSAFQKALRDALKPVRELEDSLKLIDRQLKFDPSNTTLLQTRMEALRKAVDELEKAHETLNTQYQKANELIEKGDLDRSNKKYIQLETTLADVERKMDLYNDEIEETERALQDSEYAQEKFGDSIEETGNKAIAFSGLLSNVATSIKNYLIRAFKDLAQEVYKTSLEMEYLESDLRALYGDGATEEQIKNLTKYAKDLSSETIYSATQIQEAMSFMARAGYDAQQTADSVKATLDLAQATGEESTRLASIVVDGLTAFGYSANEASRFANVLAVVANETNAEVADLGESFKFAGALAGAFGYDVEDVATALGVMASAGIKGSQAGTTLRSLFTRLATNTGKARDELTRLGVAFFDTQGNARPLNDVLEDMRKALQGMSDQKLTTSLKKIAGQQGITGLTAIINASNEEWDELKASVQESGNYIEELADVKTDNLQSDITKLKNTILALGTDAIEPLNPLMRDAVQDLQKMFDVVRSSFNGEPLYDVSESTRKAVDEFNELIKKTNELNTAFAVENLKTKDEAKSIDELISSLDGRNKKDEEYKKIQDEIKQKLDLINSTFGTNIKYDVRNNALKDEQGEVESLEQAYDDLALARNKSYYLEQYNEVYLQSLNNVNLALKDMQDNILALDKAEAGLNEEERALWNEYTSQAPLERSRMYATLNGSQKNLIDTMNVLTAHANQSTAVWQDTTHVMEGVTQAYHDIENATTNGDLQTALFNIGNELDFTKQEDTLNSYKAELEDLMLMASDPARYGMTAEDVTQTNARIDWLQDRIAKEQEYQSALANEQQTIAQNNDNIKAMNNSLFNDPDTGMVAVSKQAIQTIGEDNNKTWDESFQKVEESFQQTIGNMAQFSRQNKIPIDFETSARNLPASYRDLFYSSSLFNSGGFQSSGLMSGGTITLNNTFTVNTNNVDRQTVKRWTSWIVDDVNEALGRKL